MKKVCVLGSGYAGLFSAANLLTDNDFKNKFEIRIFDKNPYHQLLQQIHLVTAGIKKTSEISFPIYDLMKDDVKEGPYGKTDSSRHDVFQLKDTLFI